MNLNAKHKIPLVIFLHFYQPPTQLGDILERIVFESYYPILEIFLRNRNARATFSFPAGLAKLLIEKGFKNVIEKLNQLVNRNQIELTGTAAYHAFLPFLPLDEIKRQILVNELELSKIFPKTKRKGFFPPELTFSQKLAKVVTNLGFDWMAIPMIALGDNIPDFTTLYKLAGTNLYLFPRNKWASSVILSGVTRTKESFLDWVRNEKPVGYFLTIMDGETFGHHRPGLENLLSELAGAQEFETLQVSDLFERVNTAIELKPREASWSNEEQDFWIDREKKVVAKNPFLLWKDPKNPIHTLQWRLTKLAIQTVKSEQKTINKRKWQRIRTMLDCALASDQYWWASAKPWWSLEMIESGSFQLMKVINLATKPNSDLRKMAEDLYRKILSIAFFWQRTGLIRLRHRQLQGEWIQTPFKIRAPAEWYNQIILEFEDEIEKAAQKLEFEKAIKWRDAIYKLHAGTDIFDLSHVVNELQVNRKIPTLKPFLLHKNNEISKFAKKYLQRLKPSEIVEGKKRLLKQGFKI